MNPKMENKKSLLCLITAVVILALTSIGLLITLLNNQSSLDPTSSDLIGGSKEQVEPTISKDYTGNKKGKNSNTFPIYRNNHSFFSFFKKEIQRRKFLMNMFQLQSLQSTLQKVSLKVMINPGR